MKNYSVCRCLLQPLCVRMVDQHFKLDLLNYFPDATLLHFGQKRLKRKMVWLCLLQS